MILTTITGKKDFMRMAAKKMMKAPTKHEKLLQDKLYLICPGLFKAQWVIDDFIADFYSPLLNMSIEVDGSSHYTQLGKSNDAMKDLAFSKRNILTLKFSNREVEENIDDVIISIIACVLDRKINSKRASRWGWSLTKKQRDELLRYHKAHQKSPTWKGEAHYHHKKLCCYITE